MNAPSLRRAEEIFSVVIDADAAERLVLLDDLCGDDHELRAMVSDLIAEDAAAGSGPLDASPPGVGGVMPERAAGAAGAAGAHASLSALSSIGPYRILRVLGEGGMAVVYEAGQDNPRRTVAVKVIRSGLASLEVQRRFLHEAHVLGQLRHPGIAQVYQAGVSDPLDAPDGRGRTPYIAMEYVRGPSLTAYAREAGLSISARLELVARVCDAVQYAHQRGVIHRDLKPANILVEESDPSAPGATDTLALAAQPKILDFGVARVTGQDLQTPTMATRAGQVLGTIAYMSPEQLGGRADQVDTRSDVYSLGVILFELLAGRLPHDLDDVPLPEVARRARESATPRLGSLDRRLRGEIEIIVARALERDRERRYQSARDLASDLRRHLRGEAIEARRDSAVYVLRKAMHRHRGWTAAGSLAVIALVSFAAFAWVQAQRFERMSDDERAARRTAELALDKADALAREATRESDKSRRVSAFLGDVLKLAGQTPDRQSRTLTSVLDDASARLDAKALSEFPDVEADVRETLAECYGQLHLCDGAIRQRRWLADHIAAREGTSSAAYGQAMGRLAGAYNEGARQPEAEHAARASLEAFTKALPPDSRPTLGAMDLLGNVLMRMGRAEEALAMAEAAAAGIARTYGPSSTRAAAAYFNLGGVYRGLGRRDEMEREYLRAMPILESTSPHSIAGIRFRYTYAMDCLVRAGRHAEAEPHLRETVARAERVFGATHPETLMAQRCLARALAGKGDPEAAVAILREAHRIGLGESHWIVADEAGTLTMLVDQLRALSRLDEARQAARAFLDKADRLRGPESYYSIAALDALVLIELDDARLDEARRVIDQIEQRAANAPKPRDARVERILGRQRERKLPPAS